MNRLIWIEDMRTRMEHILDGACYKFWEKNIFSRIVFFGDAYGEEKDADIAAFPYALKSAFALYRASNEGRAKASDQKQQDLIRRIETQCCVSAIKISAHQRHIDAWKKIDCNIWVPGTDLDPIYTPSYIDALVEEAVDAGDEAVFALDLDLLEGDKDRLRGQRGESAPILSMELYHYIRYKLKKECVLLTANVLGDPFPSKWEKIYKHRYAESVDITIIPREDFHRGTLDVNGLEKIECLFHRRETP